MKVKLLLSQIQKIFPFEYSESYDNVGLVIGNHDDAIKGIILCLNVTEEVVNEAIKKSCNLIISHHPLIFHGLKQITNQSQKEKIIRLCITKNINVIALHTNIDKSYIGLNKYIAEQLGLKNITTLSPEKDLLRKLVVFCPTEHANKVRTALFEAGAGVIGNYDSCSYNISGFGTFKGNEKTKPFVGKQNEIHQEEEIRIETIFPQHLQYNVLKALSDTHPYEEIAFDIYPLENEYNKVGLGIVGELDKAMTKTQFLEHIKRILKTPCLRYSNCENDKISTVAFCGGSGSQLIQNAIKQKADAFVTADLSYHQFEIDNKLLLIDAGHFETEVLFKDFFENILSEININFVVFKSETELNHINYF